jgi:hypothetical protein
LFTFTHLEFQKVACPYTIVYLQFLQLQFTMLFTCRNFLLTESLGELETPFFVLLRVHICRDSDTPKVRVTGSVSTSTSGAGVVPGPRQTGTGSARYCHIFIRFIPCLCSLQEEGSSASCQHQPMLPERNSCGKLLPRIEIVSL